MHISEGIITGTPMVAYTVIGVAIVGYGAHQMKKFIKEQPEKKALIGMAAAFIFFLSLIPIPAFTGTTSHPCGSPLAGILLGPFIGAALTGITLIFQAAFFAHGGFSTWGANVVTLGIGGAFFGWAAFKVSRKAGLGLVASAGIGGLIGDLMTYVFAGGSLSLVLSSSEGANYTFTGYLVAIYLSYIPTQVPIALLEMGFTALIISYIYKQRPEVLRELKVISSKVLSINWILLSVVTLMIVAPTNSNANEISKASNEQVTEIIGMDEAINEMHAENAGKEPRAPYIDTESLGDLWNTIMLLAGAICGFVIGKNWDLLFKKKSNSGA